MKILLRKMKILLRKMKILLRGENVPGDMFSACRPFHHSRDIPESSKEYAAAASIVYNLLTICSQLTLDTKDYMRYNQDTQMSKKKKEVKKMSRKLRKAEQEKAVQEYIAYCKKNKEEKNDKGAFGKIADVLGREYVTKRLRCDDIKARSAGRADCTFKGSDGKMHSIEFKTGAGALAYEYDDEFIDVDRLLEGVEYFAYNPKYCDNMQVQKQFFVTTREDFLDLLISYSEKKPLTWFKRNKEYRQVNIQEFNTSNKKYDYLMNALYDWPTLEQFIADQRG